MTCIAVGISGEVAAGKSTAADELGARGFGYTRISKVIDLILDERGLERSRENHQTVGWELHNEKGQAWLCEQAIGLLGNTSKPLVLDGVRWRDDAAYMKKRYGSAFLHIHILAPEHERKRRFESEKKGISYEEVIAHPVEQQVAGLGLIADQVLINDESKHAFLVDVLGCVLERLVDAS